MLRHLILALARGYGKWIFSRFSRQRRAICIAHVVLGFFMALPLMLFIWTGHAEDVPPGWGIPLLIGVALGIVVITLGFGLLTVINEMGSPDERM